MTETGCCDKGKGGVEGARGAEYGAVRMKLIAGVFVAVVILVATSIFINLPSPQPDLPIILKEVSAGGGWWGACPNELRKNMPLAVSPELEQRLMVQFPPGSSEEKLVNALKEQGFTFLPPCKSDPSIRSMWFRQIGGSFARSTINANIFWKIDQDSNVVWTKGFVSYSL